METPHTRGERRPEEPMQIAESTHEVPPIDEVDAARPRIEKLRAEVEAIHAALDAAQTAEARAEAVLRWDDLRRAYDTWSSLTHLHFQQDTRNERYEAEREYADELQPKVQDLDVRMKKTLLASEHRPELEARFGTHAFALWSADVATFDPAIEDSLVREAKLCADYTRLLASATFAFDGEETNLPGIRKHTVSADRSTREAAQRARWAWFAENREQLDRIFAELVAVRTEMARALGYESYTELGYRRMQRVDYDASDVETFRGQVREQLVPLCTAIHEAQRERLGLDELMYWDEPVHDKHGNPAPLGDEEWMVERAREMFTAMTPALGKFFAMMADRGYLDLETRPGKAGGGFCTGFPKYGVPFIFANFNGTKGDVEVFTHEMGHAFQAWKSRHAELTEYLWPTYESCEIHSMSLEFLTWPHMELFFGEDAERFRRVHLLESLLFLPYGVAVDHFQHLVYERPEASPAERHAMWQEMERTYLPWRSYGGMAHVADGGRWQLQRHIYASPFYYIDYTLAQTCALQFWVRAAENEERALADYTALCTLGGTKAFGDLVRSAGLVSPFTEGALDGATRRAREVLGIG